MYFKTAVNPSMEAPAKTSVFLRVLKYILNPTHPRSAEGVGGVS